MEEKIFKIKKIKKVSDFRVPELSNYPNRTQTNNPKEISIQVPELYPEF